MDAGLAAVQAAGGGAARGGGAGAARPRQETLPLLPDGAGGGAGPPAPARAGRARRRRLHEGLHGQADAGDDEHHQIKQIVSFVEPKLPFLFRFRFRLWKVFVPGKLFFFRVWI